jgi:hypothetical protein
MRKVNNVSIAEKTGAPAEGYMMRVISALAVVKRKALW